MSLFTNVSPAPRDPILGLNEAFNNDTRPNKINLGVGIYQNNQGVLPVLTAVKEAIIHLNKANMPCSYLPIDGLAAYNNQVQKLIFGENSSVIEQKRAVTTQALGGTGALKIGADFLRHNLDVTHVAISNPSWENHQALFARAGFNVSSYRYYDSANKCLDFSGMLEDLANLPEQSVVVLHACCHNPTGVDLSLDQFKQVINVIQNKNHIPFIDMAYQGFAQSLDLDAAFVRYLADANLEFLVANSFSKSFSLYGERVGAITLVCKDQHTAQTVQTQIKRTVRTIYSNSPSFGAQVVANVMANNDLRRLWQDELDSMRERILTMRSQLVAKLAQINAGDFSFIVLQRGMFSYSGLTAAQVIKLRDDFAIYAVENGRICLAALNSNNIDTVANAIKQVTSN